MGCIRTKKTCEIVETGKVCKQLYMSRHFFMIQDLLEASTNYYNRLVRLNDDYTFFFDINICTMLFLNDCICCCASDTWHLFRPKLAS